MKKFIYGVLAFVPALAFAQGNIQPLINLTGQLGVLIGKIIPVMFAIAIVYFFWGLIKYIMKAGDPKEAAAGKSIMIYGVIAIAVMVSIYGLVAFLRGSLGVGSETTLPLPTVNF